MEPAKIEITVDEYNRLLEDSKKLHLLYSYGVDNWPGFEFAMEEYEKDNEE